MEVGSICGRIYTGKIDKCYGFLEEIIGEASWKGFSLGYIFYKADEEKPQFNDIFYSKGNNNLEIVGGNNHKSVFGEEYTSDYYSNFIRLSSKVYSNLNEFLKSL